MDRVVSEVLSFKDGGGARAFGKKLARELALIKDKYIFIFSFNKYVLSDDHRLGTELSPGNIVMNK